MNAKELNYVTDYLNGRSPCTRKASLAIYDIRPYTESTKTMANVFFASPGESSSLRLSMKPQAPSMSNETILTLTTITNGFP